VPPSGRSDWHLDEHEDVPVQVEIPLVRQMSRLFVAAFVLVSFASRARAQAADADRAAAIAVSDSVLAALSSGDGKTLARLTLDSAVVGGVGLRNGVERLSLRSWALYINRSDTRSFTERGFDATARVQDRVA
jgi:hypothetical protein